MNPTLSILIPGVPSRIPYAQKLINELQRQIDKTNAVREVELLWLVDNRARPIGAKRQALLDIAKGSYVAFCDDDDWVKPAYINGLLAACAQGQDVVTFLQDATWNQTRAIVRFNVTNLADGAFVHNTTVQRRPWHVCAWRRSLAQKCIYPATNWGEDALWVDQACQHLHRGAHIEQILHVYNHQDAKSEATALVKH